MNTKTKEGARNKGNPYFLRVPWNKGGLVNTGPDFVFPKINTGNSKEELNHRDCLDQHIMIMAF